MKKKLFVAVNRNPVEGNDEFFIGTMEDIQAWMEEHVVSLADTRFYEVGQEVRPKLLIVESE